MLIAIEIFGSVVYDMSIKKNLLTEKLEAIQ